MSKKDKARMGDRLNSESAKGVWVTVSALSRSPGKRKGRWNTDSVERGAKNPKDL